MEFEAVRNLIQERFPSLSRQLQIGARFLLDRPDEVAVASMRALAGRAGVQPATFVRLAQTLGFSGWPAFRRPFVEHLRAGREPFSRRAAELVRHGAKRSLAAEAFAAQRANLAATESYNRADDLAEAAGVIERARTLYIAGFRSCFPAAFAFHYVYRLFRSNAVLLGGAAGGLEIELREIGTRDAVLAIGFSPYSREIGLVLDAAARAQAKRIAVTDSEVSPLALGADRVLRFALAGPFFFPSTAAATSLLECLLAVLMNRAGDNAVARVRAAESQLFALGAYLPSATKGRRP